MTWTVCCGIMVRCRKYLFYKGLEMLSSVTSYQRVVAACEWMPTLKRDAIMERWRAWLWGWKPNLKGWESV